MAQTLVEVWLELRLLVVGLRLVLRLALVEARFVLRLALSQRAVLPESAYRALSYVWRASLRVLRPG